MQCLRVRNHRPKSTARPKRVAQWHLFITRIELAAQLKLRPPLMCLFSFQMRLDPFRPNLVTRFVGVKFVVDEQVLSW